MKKILADVPNTRKFALQLSSPMNTCPFLKHILVLLEYIQTWIQE